MLFFTEHEHEAANCEFFPLNQRLWKCYAVQNFFSLIQHETWQALWNSRFNKFTKRENRKNSLITVGECFHAFWVALLHQTVNLLWRKHRSCWMIVQVFAHFFLSKCSRTSSGMFISRGTNDPSFSREWAVKAMQRCIAASTTLFRAFLRFSRNEQILQGPKRNTMQRQGRQLLT